MNRQRFSLVDIAIEASRDILYRLRDLENLHGPLEEAAAIRLINEELFQDVDCQTQGLYTRPLIDDQRAVREETIGVITSIADLIKARMQAEAARRVHSFHEWEEPGVMTEQEVYRHLIEVLSSELIAAHDLCYRQAGKKRRAIKWFLAAAGTGSVFAYWAFVARKSKSKDPQDRSIPP